MLAILLGLALFFGSLPTLHIDDGTVQTMGVEQETGTGGQRRQ